MKFAAGSLNLVRNVSGAMVEVHEPPRLLLISFQPMRFEELFSAVAS